MKHGKHDMDKDHEAILGKTLRIIGPDMATVEFRNRIP